MPRLVHDWTAMVRRRSIDNYETAVYRVGLPEVILLAVAFAPAVALGLIPPDLTPPAFAAVLGWASLVWLIVVLASGAWLIIASHLAARRYWRGRERGR